LDARRPWLPAALVKWIDERRGRWMYAAGGPVKERWFRPGGLARRLARDFADVRVDYLLRPQEAHHPLFWAVPRARLMVLWSARVPETRPESQLPLRKPHALDVRPRSQPTNRVEAP
jgi:hypothetical protein